MLGWACNDGAPVSGRLCRDGLVMTVPVSGHPCWSGLIMM